MSSTLNGAVKASQSRVLIPIHNLHLKVSLIAVCNELLTYKSSFNISSLILHLGNNNCAIFNNLVSLFLDSNPIQMKLRVFYHFQDQDEEEEECASRLAPHESKKIFKRMFDRAPVDIEIEFSINVNGNRKRLLRSLFMG